MKNWKPTALSHLLNPISRTETVDPGKEYQLLGIRLDGQGPFLRETKLGSQISAKVLFRVHEGDFIYSRLFAWRGAFGIISKELAGCYVSGEFPIFNAKDERLDVKYLFYWFRLPSTLESVLADCTGSTPLTRNRFKEEFFLRKEIPLPLLKEQQRIVAKIEQLTAKVFEAARLRRVASEKTVALIYAELSSAYDSAVKKYGVLPLEELIIEAGYGSSEKCSAERQGGQIPVLRIPNVVSEKITFENLKYALFDSNNLKKLSLNEGDILVVRTNGSLDLVGRSAVVPPLNEVYVFASYMIRLRLDTKKVVPEYVQRMLQYLRISGSLVDFARTTAGQYNVSLGRLNALQLPVPSNLKEQRQILSRIDQLQAKVEHVKKIQSETTAELDVLMPSILDRAFKGEL